jgi:hypothetical protein
LESIHQQAFDDVKATIAKEVVLAYPDFTKPFKIYTDASTTQLRAVITQGNKPIAFFSRKLSEMQSKYSVTKIKLLAIVETLKVFQGMMWGQTIKVYTDHKNLTRDALGLTSDRVYRWRLLLEEFAPEIVYKKGIHNLVADVISQLGYNPEVNPTSKFKYSTFGVPAKGETTIKWKTFSKLWCCYDENNPGNETQECNLNKVFANRSKEEKVFPLTTPEIAEAQKANSKLMQCFMCNAVLDKGLDVRLLDNTYVVCKDSRMIIPKPLQRRTVLRNHHYLQHPGHTRLEETVKATMYWKGMRSTIRSITKSCRSCQVNKKRKLKFGQLLSKIVITIPWRTLCVDLIGPNTHTSKNGTVIDFMALTMINPMTSWFKVVELTLICQLKTVTVDGKESSIVEEIFDKSSERIAWLVNKT